MTTYTLKCSKCRATSEYTEKPGRPIYESCERDGWIWSEKRGWLCTTCEFTRITKPIVTQAALI